MKHTKTQQGKNLICAIIFTALLLSLALVIQGCGGGAGGGGGTVPPPDNPKQTGSFKVTIKIPTSSDMQAQYIPYGTNVAYCQITGEAFPSTPIIDAETFSGGQATLQLTGVPVGLNTVLLQVYKDTDNSVATTGPDAGDVLMSQRKIQYFQTSATFTNEGNPVQLGVCIVDDGSGNALYEPKNMEVECDAGNKIYFENCMTGTHTVVLTDSGSTVRLNQVLNSPAGTPTVYDSVPFTCDTVDTYTFTNDKAPRGSLVVYGAPSPADAWDSHNYPKQGTDNNLIPETGAVTVNFTVSGSAFGSSLAAVDGKVYLNRYDSVAKAWEATNIQATVDSWSNTVIKAHVDLSTNGKYRILIKSRNWSLVPVPVNFFKGSGDVDIVVE